MWGTSLIVDRLEPQVNPDRLRKKEEDKLVLTWEERRWLRGRFMTAKGRKIGIALPTGIILEPGAVLFVGEDWYLKVEGAVEPVLEIIPSCYDEAVRIAFEVGNRHFPMELKEGKVLVPDDKAMVRLMERLGARWERRRAVFNPIANTQVHQHGSFS
jgi:urease accessory protein